MKAYVDYEINVPEEVPEVLPEPINDFWRVKYPNFPLYDEPGGTTLAPSTPAGDYPFLDSDSGWVNIAYSGTSGWISDKSGELKQYKGGKDTMGDVRALTRIETILDGGIIEPIVRFEYFLMKAMADRGVGITDVRKTGTSGAVDTYTIYMTDGTTKTFTVTNGTATDAQVEQYVSDWLDLHPEATTTVQDGSVTDAKLVQSGGIFSAFYDNGYTRKLVSGDFVSGYDNGLNNDYTANITDNSYHRYISASPYIQLSAGDAIHVKSETLEIAVGYYASPGSASVKLVDYTKLPTAITLIAPVDGYYFVTCRKSSSGPAITVQEYSAEVSVSRAHVLSKLDSLETIINDSGYPDTVMPVTGFAAGVNAYISGGKLTYATSNARASSGLFRIPDGYNWMIPEAAPGYAGCVHRVNVATLAAQTISSWNFASAPIPVDHDSMYIVQGAMRDISENVTMPEDGVLMSFRLFKDEPMRDFCEPQTDMAYSLLNISSSTRPQGMGINTEGTECLICRPGVSGSTQGTMTLIDIASGTVKKTVTFSGEAYGHMNDVAFREGLWYIPYYKADGMAQDKCLVFDSTLENPTELPLVDENGDAFACWRMCYNKLTDQFLAAAHNDYTFLVYDGDMNYVKTLTLSGSTTIAGSTKTWMQGCETDGKYLYIVNVSHDFSRNYVTVHDVTDGTFVGTILFSIAGNEAEALCYDWTHDLFYYGYYSKPDGDGIYGVKVLRVNFYAHPNVPKMLSDIIKLTTPPPTANGTYTLTATVSGGTVTYSWT